MTEYVFEVGRYPDERVIDRRVCVSEADAVAHAKRIGADYVWCVLPNENPSHVWRRGEP